MLEVREHGAAPLAWIAAQIARHLTKQDMVYLADDDQQAQAITAALRGMLPEARVFFMPSSDALPGDVAPASPANVGMRVAALHAAVADRPRIAAYLASPRRMPFDERGIFRRYAALDG